MKTIVLFLVLLFPVWATAEPFLVCDVPDSAEQVESYTLFMDGIEFATVFPDETGAYGFILDLNGIDPARYVFTAYATNAWGDSDLSDPYTAPKGVLKPTGMKLRKNINTTP